MTAMLALSQGQRGCCRTTWRRDGPRPPPVVLVKDATPVILAARVVADGRARKTNHGGQGYAVGTPLVE
jgi:hypothetical protein